MEEHVPEQEVQPMVQPSAERIAVVHLKLPPLLARRPSDLVRASGGPVYYSRNYRPEDQV